MEDGRGAGSSAAEGQASKAESGGGEFPLGFVVGIILASVLWTVLSVGTEQSASVWTSFDRLTRILELLILCGGLYSLVLLRRQAETQTAQLREQLRQHKDELKQYRDEAKWRKLLSYHDYFARFPPDDARQAFVKVIKDKGLSDHLRGKGSEIKDDDAKALIEDSDALSTIRSYLDGYEQFCGAVNCAVIDEEYAYSLEGTRVIRIHRVVKRVIERLQSSNRKAYIELERLAEAWEARRLAEEKDSKERDGVKRHAPGS